MRYFKYKNTNKNNNNAWKEHWASLTKDEKRMVKKEKYWRRFSSVVTFILFISFVIAINCLLKTIPRPAVGWQEVFVVAGTVIAWFVLLAISGFFTYWITYPLWKKVGSFNIPLMKKEIFSKACAHLRDFYGLREPYIITKCYDSSDSQFKNHDVCIFVVEDELCITTDLINGFLYGDRDLGCYALKKEEIVLSKKRNANLLIAEVTSKEISFLLGYRAKSFIEKNFL
ncbi:MAG: hypothetical protein IJV77_06415 [Clostridia bacterium]|nr:hypothetical protein [Clostridia bacterium]